MEAVAGWVRRGAAAILQMGPVPQHIAFIMDGNRRFAERLQLEAFRGHSRGYDKLVQALEWCLELGVPCVSVYAFSLENFNRSAAEVAVLMDLAERKLLAILQERGIVERHGVRVQVLGDLSRLPDRVAAAAQRCMAATSHQTRCVLNICLAYTATQEMWQAVTTVQQRVAAGKLVSADVSIDTIQQHLYTKGCPPVDLMIRTSGETRLSDFLLAQSGHATLHFSAALWPDFSFLDMLGALAQYQRDAPTLQRNAQASQQRSADSQAAQPLLMPACRSDVRHDAAASGAACIGDSSAAERQQQLEFSTSPVSPGAQHAPRRRHAARGAYSGHPDIGQAAPLSYGGTNVAAEGTSPGAATCRAASKGKIGMRTSLQFDVIANSTAPALISR